MHEGVTGPFIRGEDRCRCPRGQIPANAHERSNPTPARPRDRPSPRRGPGRGDRRGLDHRPGPPVEPGRDPNLRLLVLRGARAPRRGPHPRGPRDRARASRGLLRAAGAARRAQGGRGDDRRDEPQPYRVSRRALRARHRPRRHRAQADPRPADRERATLRHRALQRPRLRLPLPQRARLGERVRERLRPGADRIPPGGPARRRRGEVGRPHRGGRPAEGLG